MKGPRPGKQDSTPEPRAGSATTRICRRLGRARTLFVGLMYELSDQGAYRRHLAAHGRVHSPAEWRAFSDARLKAKYERAKCC